MCSLKRFLQPLGLTKVLGQVTEETGHRWTQTKQDYGLTSFLDRMAIPQEPPHRLATMNKPKYSQRCPDCDRKITGSLKHVGLKVRCPGCGNELEFKPNSERQKENKTPTTSHTGVITPTNAPKNQPDITRIRIDEKSFHEVPIKDAQGDCRFIQGGQFFYCLLYTSPSPRDQRGSRMPSSA